MALFANAFDALADSPAEAASLTARAELLVHVRERLRRWDLPVEAAAARLNIGADAVDDILSARIDRFDLDALAAIATAAGFTVRIHVEDAA